MGSNSPLENVDPLLDSSPLPPTHYSGILATCPGQHFSKEPACTHTLVNSNRRLFIGFSDSQSRDLRTIISRSDPYTEQKDLVKGTFQCDRKLKTSNFRKQIIHINLIFKNFPFQFEDPSDEIFFFCRIYELKFYRWFQTVFLAFLQHGVHKEQKLELSAYHT